MPVSHSEELLGSLKERYANPSRYYHNLRHIREMILGFIRHKNMVEDQLSTFLAIWFHDVVFETKSQNNEEASADFAAYELQKLKLPGNTIKTCCEMVLSTKQHVPHPNTADCQLLLDLDLMILGQSPDRYKEYSNCIRQEYSWVPDDTYADGRAKVLEKFLNRDRIYYTDRFYQEYEALARDNLFQELQSIEKARSF